MCEECMPEIDNIDDLLEQYEEQQREVYISDTSDAICELGYIAEKLESAYENEYRHDPTYKNEERMRYWRYIKEEHRHDGGYYRGDGYAWQNVADIKDRYIWFVRRHGKFGGLTSGEEAALAAIDLVLAVGSPAFFVFAFLMLVVGPAK